MKKIIVTIIGIIILFIIFGCANSIDQYKIVDLKVKKIAEGDNHYSVSIIELSNKIDKNKTDNSVANVGSYVINKNTIYFVVNNEVKGDVTVSSSELYEYNISTSKIRKIYSIIGGEGYLGISTLESNSDHLFWIEEKNVWEIKSYDIETEKVNVVDKKNNTQVSPNISVVGELLCWFKIDDMKSNKIDLITYNTKDKKIQSLCNDNLYLSNAYSKIPNSNRYILYTTKENGKLVINRYDIISKLKVRVESYNKQITFTNCSDDYIIYSTDWIGGEIYLLNVNKKNSSRILELEPSESIRSILIKDNIIYFDFAAKKNIDKENKPRIFTYDLNQNTIFEIDIINADNNINFSWLKSSSEKITMDYSINNESNINRGIMFLEKK